jgi:hypothetical protein
MKNALKKFSSPQITKKALSSPNFEQEKMYQIQQISLESLNNLIKTHQSKFFSTTPLGDDNNFIIETLKILKQSLSNSLFNQTQERNLFFKNV